MNVPPPEIVYQDAAPNGRALCLHPRWSLFHRNCGPQPSAPNQTVTFAPLNPVVTGALFAAFNQGAVNFGAANAGVAGFTLANVPAPVNPVFVTQATAAPQMSAAHSGLAAIHQAELYAASVAAGRAQQDAELRVMMAALDRARGSMAASAAAAPAGAASVAGGCPEMSCESMKALIAATTANSKQIGVLAVKMDDLDRRLRDLTEAVDLLNQRQKGMLAPPKIQPEK